MGKGPGKIGFVRGWWVTVLVCCTAAGAALVVRFVWRSSRGAQKQTDDDSEGIEESSSEAHAQSPLVVREHDWHELQLTALGQQVPAQDRQLQLLVERCFPCDAIDILQALFKPGSAFWTHWQEQQNHHHIVQGEWHKQSTPLGYTKWTRECKYRMPLNKLTSMGASFADNTEIQTIQHASREAWKLSVHAVTAHVPMANLFRCVLNLTANNENTSGRPHCRLCVYGDVVFHKHQPLKEALVRRPALNGMRNTYVQMLQLLQEQLQLWKQEKVASVPLPALQNNVAEDLLDAREPVCEENQHPLKQTPKGLRSLKSTGRQDTLRLQKALQTLAAAIVFFAVLLAAERAAVGASGPAHRQNRWMQFLWCRDLISCVDMHKAV